MKGAHRFHGKPSGSQMWEVKMLLLLLNLAWSFWKLVQRSSPTFIASAPVCPRHKPPKTITHTRRMTKTPAFSRALLRFTAAPLQPIIIDDLFNPEEETEVRGCPLISSLWTWRSCGCFMPAHSHMHTLSHHLNRSCVTLWPRNLLHWISLTNSAADLLCKAKKKSPQQSIRARVWC